ncbi:MAG: flagellin, partial [Pantoea sp.]|nr:flagellin [Pantoea sp.]
DGTGTGVSYAGGTDAITQKVDSSRTMTVGHTGDDIFMAITGNATKQTFQAAMDKTNRGLGNSLNNVLTVRSEIGTQLSELDTLDAQGDDRNVIYSSQMSDLVDVDYTAAVSSYTMQQTALQASYKTFTDMSKMSLFQLNS